MLSEQNCRSVSSTPGHTRLDVRRAPTQKTTSCQELGHFPRSGSTPAPSVTSASKAVDCAVISTRGNMTTRPTAQNTTSASGWFPLWLHCPTSASLRCVSIRPVPVRVKAHDDRGVRKNPQENERKTRARGGHGHACPICPRLRWHMAADPQREHAGDSLLCPQAGSKLNQKFWINVSTLIRSFWNAAFMSKHELHRESMSPSGKTRWSHVRKTFNFYKLTWI